MKWLCDDKQNVSVRQLSDWLRRVYVATSFHGTKFTIFFALHVARDILSDRRPSSLVDINAVNALVVEYFGFESFAFIKTVYILYVSRVYMPCPNNIKKSAISNNEKVDNLNSC